MCLFFVLHHCFLAILRFKGDDHVITFVCFLILFSGVERLLERIKNGVLAEDRRRAMEELQDIVAESRSAQLALGAMGIICIIQFM